MNRTVDQIILESPLVQVYRNLHTTFARNFLHTHLSTRHAEADMIKTFSEVCKKMMQNSPHIVQMGRKSKYIIPDLIGKGTGLIDKGEWGSVDIVEDTSEATPANAAILEDVVVELDI